MHFDEQLLKRICIRIPHGPLTADEFEFEFMLDMKGMVEGPHKIRAEMYELWASTERLNFTSKEVTVKYVPIGREDRLIELPIVKSIEGTDLAIVSDSDKEVYREIQESRKKELNSKRDEW